MRAFAFLSLSLCLALCTESARDVLPEPVASRPVVHVADSNECEACVWGIRFTEDILADPDLVSIMGGKVAQAICQELPSDKQPNCLEYAQIIFQVVVGYLQASYHEALPQLACAPMCADSTPRGLFVPHRQSDVRGVMECAFCEYAVTQIQEAMEDDAERAAVMNDARAACKKLPESLQAACEQYVDEKGPIIIALVESAEPEKVCETLNACEDTRRPALPAEVVQVSAKLASLLVPALRPAPTGSAILRGPQECELCKVAVMEIHDKLDDPAFQQAVIAYAKRVCDRLGENFATQCTQMVDQYAPLVFSMLEDELKPQEFCEMIHLCEPRRVAA